MPSRKITGIIALAALALLWTTHAAIAQSDRDLREENQRLQTQVNDLQRELDAAQNRIEELERDLARLLARLGPSTTAPVAPTAPEQVSIDETVPNASPRALFNALVESYGEATQDLEIGEPGTMMGDRHRAAYMRAVENWARRVQRELRSAVVWNIRLVEHQPPLPELRVEAVNPQTGTTLGQPFSMRLNKLVRHKFEQLDSRGQADELVVKGVLTPRVTINRNRTETGPFDNPRLIGPFVEFGFTLNASSMTAKESEER